MKAAAVESDPVVGGLRRRRNVFLRDWRLDQEGMIRVVDRPVSISLVLRVWGLLVRGACGLHSSPFSSLCATAPNKSPRITLSLPGKQKKRGGGASGHALVTAVIATFRGGHTTAPATHVPHYARRIFFSKG